MAPGIFQWHFRSIIFKLILELVIEVSPMKLHSREYHCTLLMIINVGSSNDLIGALRQQAIILANVDPDICRHMVSLGHNELINFLLFSQHRFLSYFTPQYPQLTCLSAQPLSISASSVTCPSSTTNKHHLNLLSSIKKSLLTHNLASFWRKQSCLYLISFQALQPIVSPNRPYFWWGNLRQV